MDNFSVFVGGLSGIFKGLKITNNKGVHNVKNLQKLKEITKRNEVTVLNWADKLESEILIGYSDQQVKIFDLSTNTFVFSKDEEIGDGPVRGIFRLNGSLVTAVESGLVKVWGDSETVIDTGGPLSRMRQSPAEENTIGTGGKENDLKLWDLATGKTTFQAKNVRHDELELRVPVWVMDLAFMRDSKQVAVATRHGHVRLYDPSTPTRRPVCQVTGKDLSFTCITPAHRDNHVVVGCTTGYMYLVDLRGKGLLLNQFRGFQGSVRQVACPLSGPHVISVSLDRHLRVHNLNTKKLLHKEYMQSRLSSLLLKSSFTMEDIKEEKEIKEEVEELQEEKEIDEEYEELFNNMEVVTEKQTSQLKMQKKARHKQEDCDLESEEDFEEHPEVVSEDTSKRIEKRSKSKSKVKTKRLKRREGEVVVVN